MTSPTLTEIIAPAPSWLRDEYEIAKREAGSPSDYPRITNSTELTRYSIKSRAHGEDT